MTRKFGSRICDRCGQVYFRVNKCHVWVAQNWGHRLGWTRSEQRVCCRCMGDREARAIVDEINPHWQSKSDL